MLWFSTSFTAGYAYHLKSSFNLNGKMLLQFNNITGRSQISVDGNKLPAGMYFYSLICNGEEIITKKMVVSK
jgi:hypothetical protein